MDLFPRKKDSFDVDLENSSAEMNFQRSTTEGPNIKIRRAKEPFVDRGSSYTLCTGQNYRLNSLFPTVQSVCLYCLSQPLQINLGFVFLPKDYDLPHPIRTAEFGYN